jgi:hypothetical protein
VAVGPGRRRGAGRRSPRRVVVGVLRPGYRVANRAAAVAGQVPGRSGRNRARRIRGAPRQDSDWAPRSGCDRLGLATSSRRGGCSCRERPGKDGRHLGGLPHRVRRTHRRAGLRPAHRRFPCTARAAQGRARIPAVCHGQPGRGGVGTSIRASPRRSRRGGGRAHRQLRPGAAHRCLVRAGHGLRGVPGEPDARKLPRGRRSQACSSRRRAAKRPSRSSFRPDHGVGVRRLHLHRRPDREVARARAHGRRAARRLRRQADARPAAMAVLGRYAWFLPSWLDHVLPAADIEGASLPERAAPAQTAVPQRPQVPTGPERL